MKAKLSAYPQGTSIEITNSGLIIVNHDDFQIQVSEANNEAAQSISIGAGHSKPELIHYLHFVLADGIEVSMEPEIGNEKNFIFTGHRRGAPPQVIYNRVYLTTCGKWMPCPEGYGPTPKDAMRVNLGSIVGAINKME